MKCNLSRAGCAAVCLAISLALGGCAALPAASDVPGTSGSTAASVPTDSDGKPLYDSTLLQDGRLRALYSYDGVGSTTVLHGSEVLYQSASSENVALLEDTVTGETNYWTRSWSDPTGRGGRRTALYDAAGTEVMAFDGEQSATLRRTACWCCRKPPLWTASIRMHTVTAPVRSWIFPPAKACRCRKELTAVW